MTQLGLCSAHYKAGGRNSVYVYEHGFSCMHTDPEIPDLKKFDVYKHGFQCMHIDPEIPGLPQVVGWSPQLLGRVAFRANYQ